MKKKLFLFIIVILLLASSIGLIACKENAPVENVAIEFQKAADSEDGYASVSMRGDSLKVLQLSDPQVDLSNKYEVIGGSNANTYVFIEKLIRNSKPDLVVINGDLVMAAFLSNVNAFIEYAEMLDSTCVPWTFAFGNHDCENLYTLGKNVAYEDVDIDKIPQSGQVSKQFIIKLMSQYKYCLLSVGDCKDGYGNNFVNVKNDKGEIVYTVCILDTLYEGSEYSHVITSAQTEWYVENINKISDLRYGNQRDKTEVVKSIVYTHVGIPEFYTAWQEAYNNGNPTEKYFYGDYCDGNYTKYINDTNFFDTAVQLGSTEAMFFAHHHDNDFSVEYKGIRLTFGQHSGLSHTYRLNRIGELSEKTWSFENYDRYGEKRGGTISEISINSELSIYPVLASEVIPDYYTIAIDYEGVCASLLEKGHTVYRWSEERGVYELTD